MKFLNRLEAKVTRARRLSGAKKNIEAPFEQNLAIPFMSLKQILTNKLNSNLLTKIKKKESSLSKSDLQEIKSLGPKVLSALLVDLGVIKKRDQLSLQRKLGSLISKQ